MQRNSSLDSIFLLTWFIRINLSSLIKVIKLNNHMKIKLKNVKMECDSNHLWTEFGQEQLNRSVGTWAEHCIMVNIWYLIKSYDLLE